MKLKYYFDMLLSVYLVKHIHIHDVYCILGISRVICVTISRDHTIFTPHKHAVMCQYRALLVQCCQNRTSTDPVLATNDMLTWLLSL